MLEAARKKLRALVKLIEKSKKNIVYTDFEDAVLLVGHVTGLTPYINRGELSPLH